MSRCEVGKRLKANLYRLLNGRDEALLDPEDRQKLQTLADVYTSHVMSCENCAPVGIASNAGTRTAIKLVSN